MNLQDLFDTSHPSKFNSFGPERRAKMSAAQKNRFASPEARAKMSALVKGRIPSAETRAKMSASGKGRIFSDEHRANLSAAQKGRIISEGAITGIVAGRVNSSRPLQTPDGVFPSALEYSKFVGVARITIYKRIERYPDQYYYIKDAE